MHYGGLVLDCTYILKQTMAYIHTCDIWRMQSPYCPVCFCRVLWRRSQYHQIVQNVHVNQSLRVILGPLQKAVKVSPLRSCPGGILGLGWKQTYCNVSVRQDNYGHYIYTVYSCDVYMSYTFTQFMHVPITSPHPKVTFYLLTWARALPVSYENFERSWMTTYTSPIHFFHCKCRLWRLREFYIRYSWKKKKDLH